MPQPRSPDRVPWPVTALLGALATLAGGYLALRPLASLAVLLLSVIGGLVVAAVAELLDSRERGSRWRYLRALAYLLGAVGVAVFTGWGVAAVIIAAGVALLVAGASDLLEARQSQGLDRWSSALGGLASISFGGLALAWPDVSVVVIGVLVGVRLLMVGLRLLTTAFGRARRPTPRPRLRLAGNVLGVLVAVALVLVSLTLHRGAPRPDDFYTAPDQVPSEPGVLLRTEPFTTEILEDAEAWRILYTTTRDEGHPAVASALVVVPRDRRADGIPVIAWAHGTTGVARGCAPTVLDPFEAGAFHALDELVAEGWAFVGTDYVGLGTEGPHPYLVGQPAARSVLDSVRAAHQMPQLGLGEQTVVWGHSQGGHAALWTGGVAPEYAPELDLAGVAAMAPAGNLPALVESVGAVTGGELLAAYVIDSYSRAYDDVRFEDYVRPGARPIVRAMAGRCLAEPSTLLSVATVLALDRTVWDGDPDRGPLATRLRENIPTLPVQAPLLLGQGADDGLVTTAGQDELVASLCASGGQVDYRTYAGKGHLDLVEPGSPALTDLVDWTRERLTGAVPSDSCGGIP